MSFINLNSQLPKPTVHNLTLYKGVVIDNNDPMHLDRIKCHIPELYDSELGEVPWILPVKYCMFGQGSGFGQFGAPPIGAIALVELQGNDPNFPVYRGFMLTEENVNAKYVPGTYGVLDPNGSELFVDTNSKTLTYTHVSGIQFVLNPDGTFRVNVPKDEQVQIGENANISVGGNANLTVQGNATGNISGNANLTCSELSVQASGNADFQCSQFNVKASSAHFQCPVFTGNIANTYGSGGTGASISGGIQNTGGTISSNGIVLDTHVHGGVRAGSDNTSGPQ